MAATEDNEGIAGSVKQLVSDVGLLVRKELELAREEMTAKAKAAGAGAGMLTGSALGAIFTLGSLTALVMVALGLVVPLWASMLIVTVLWAIVTGVLALLGKNKVEAAVPFVPEQTIANVKEDVEWARHGGTPARR
jgi:uncharacterized membrane protein YqjE